LFLTGGCLPHHITALMPTQKQRVKTWHQMMAPARRICKMYCSNISNPSISESALHLFITPSAPKSEISRF
jgi:hypothetical protein